MAFTLLEQPEVCLLLLRLNRMALHLLDFGPDPDIPGSRFLVSPAFERVRKRLTHVVERLGFTEAQAEELVGSLLWENPLARDAHAVRRSMSLTEALGEEALS